MKQIYNNLIWFMRELTGKCHECRIGYMDTTNEPNGDELLDSGPIQAHCTHCQEKRYV